MKNASPILCALITIVFLIPVNVFAQISIVNNGRVGVGTNTVDNTYKMHVDGESFCAVKFEVNHLKPWGWAEVSSVNIADIKSWIVNYNSTHTYFVTSNGAIFGQGSWIASDQKLKTDITDVSDGLDQIAKLKPVKYKMKIDSIQSDDPSYNYGFLAQDVRDALPDLTRFAYTDDDKKDSTLFINYDMVIPLLVKAIQEQQVMIESLRKIDEQDKISDISMRKDVELTCVPNPSNGILDVVVSGIDITAEIMLTNLAGEQVFATDQFQTSQVQKLNISHLASGIYVLHLTTGLDILASKKIIKK